MYRFALIGVTGYGKTHFADIQAMAEAGQGKPVAATVINPEEAPDEVAWLLENDCQVFGDYEEMLRKFHGKIDICFIPTGIAWHAKMTTRALEAGANVFVEKPAAALLREVRGMHTSSRAALKFVAVGFQSIYQPEIQALKARFVKNEFGSIRRLKCRGLWSRNSAYYGRNSWAGKIRDGERWVLDSPFNNALAHYLNLMLFLAGSEQDASCVPASVEAELYRANDIESADTACIRVQNESGSEVLFYATHACSTNHGPEIVIETTTANITWTAGGDWTITPHGKDAETLASTTDQRVAVREALIGRMTDANTPICSLEIAGTQTLVANAAHDSSDVREIPAELVSTTDGDDGTTLTTINGIESLIEEAFGSGKLFSEMGIAWAEPGRKVNVHDYIGLRAARPVFS